MESQKSSLTRVHRRDAWGTDFSSVFPQCLVHCLAFSKCSVNIAEGIHEFQGFNPSYLLSQYPKWGFTVCMRAQSLRLSPTLCDPMECSPPGSSVCGILQARVLEWVAVPSSRGSSNPEIEPTSLMSPALAVRFFTTGATWEA